MNARSMFQNIVLRIGIINDLFTFLWKEKMWWLIPFVAVLMLLGILMIFAHASPIAPFMYTLF